MNYEVISKPKEHCKNKKDLNKKLNSSTIHVGFEAALFGVSFLKSVIIRVNPF